jgi:hypothetical protein
VDSRHDRAWIERRLVEAREEAPDRNAPLASGSSRLDHGLEAEQRGSHVGSRLGVGQVASYRRRTADRGGRDPGGSLGEKRPTATHDVRAFQMGHGDHRAQVQHALIGSYLLEALHAMKRDHGIGPHQSKSDHGHERGAARDHSRPAPRAAEEVDGLGDSAGLDQLERAKAHGRLTNSEGGSAPVPNLPPNRIARAKPALGAEH